MLGVCCCMTLGKYCLRCSNREGRSRSCEQLSRPCGICFLVLLNYRISDRRDGEKRDYRRSRSRDRARREPSPERRGGSGRHNDYNRDYSRGCGNSSGRGHVGEPSGNRGQHSSREEGCRNENGRWVVQSDLSLDFPGPPAGPARVTRSAEEEPARLASGASDEVVAFPQQAPAAAEAEASLEPAGGAAREAVETVFKGCVGFSFRGALLVLELAEVSYTIEHIVMWSDLSPQQAEVLLALQRADAADECTTNSGRIALRAIICRIEELRAVPEPDPRYIFGEQLLQGCR